jgi:hypothetical protein
LHLRPDRCQTSSTQLTASELQSGACCRSCKFLFALSCAPQCARLQFTLNSYPKEDLPDPTLEELRRWGPAEPFLAFAQPDIVQASLLSFLTPCITTHRALCQQSCSVHDVGNWHWLLGSAESGTDCSMVPRACKIALTTCCPQLLHASDQNLLLGLLFKLEAASAWVGAGSEQVSNQLCLCFALHSCYMHCCCPAQECHSRQLPE